MDVDANDSAVGELRDGLYWKIPGYEIQKLVGRGGMASVYLATQLSLQREVALKLLHNREPGFSERFLNEGRTIATLTHRNIIVIHDIGVCDYGHYISMEFVEGGDLEGRISKGISQHEALQIIRQIAQALHFVHQHDIIHRDVKPANILFREDGTPILTDFGIAKRSRISSGLTTAGTALGTPDYLSPEQAQEKELDGRADLYGLGVILYEMLTGEKPYRGDSYVEVILQHLQAPVPKLPKAHKSLQGLLDRLLAKAPEDRFQDAGVLIAKIDELTNGIHASAGDTLKYAQQKKQRSLPLLAISVVFSLLSGAGVWYYLNAADPVPMATLTESSKAIEPPPAVAIAIPAPEKEVWEVVDETLDPPPLLDEKPEDVPAPEETMAISAQVPSSDPVVAIKTTASTEATLAEDAQEIQQWLDLAEARLSQFKLSTPKEDNARYYFQQILAKDPAHQAAKQGIDKVADHYALLAKQKLKAGNRRVAKRYIQRGLGIRPKHLELLALQRQARKPQTARQRATPSSRNSAQKGFTISDEDIFGADDY